jgi:hypothetical protein
MKRSLIPALLTIAFAAAPLSSQQVDNAESMMSACPSDRTDGPLYADGRAYYGIPARRIIEAWLGPPHDSFGRMNSGTQNVSVSSLRSLTDGMDYNACQRLTAIITGGERSAPPPDTWAYFTAGGFYFVSQWKPAQALSNYTTSYGHVMVFDSAFNLWGAYAF